MTQRIFRKSKSLHFRKIRWQPVIFRLTPAAIAPHGLAIGTTLSPSFGCGLFLGGVHIHRNAAAVVDHCDAVVGMNDDVDFIAVAGHRFVHRVVHHFPHQVVQTLFCGRPDVHGRALADRFKSAQHLDGRSVVPMTRSFAGHRFFLTHVVCVS